jgi:hypothetical protein
MPASAAHSRHYALAHLRLARVEAGLGERIASALSAIVCAREGAE